MSIIRRNCPHCPTQQVAFVLTWAAQVPNQSEHMWNCAATCSACNGPICFVAVATNTGNRTPPSNYGGAIEPTWSVDRIWPTRTDSSAPAHTPDAVKRRFIEGEDAYARASWNAAVAMYRSALDIATKALDGVPAKVTFFKRLEWLHENHRITPDMRSWADHVRVEGNDALHDPDEFSADDARPLRLFTEMFLRYVFELPGEVLAFRKETDSATVEDSV